MSTQSFCDRCGAETGIGAATPHVWNFVHLEGTFIKGKYGSPWAREQIYLCNSCTIIVWTLATTKITMPATNKANGS